MDFTVNTSAGPLRFVTDVPVAEIIFADGSRFTPGSNLGDYGVTRGSAEPIEVYDVVATPIPAPAPADRFDVRIGGPVGGSVNVGHNNHG